ncbi:hypothetical protein [Bartonella sp. ML70XJBT.G]|nr:hypothetical protein [Bartonella sp. ML70XJBT.G]
MWGRMGVWEKVIGNVGWGLTNMSKAWGGAFEGKVLRAIEGRMPA